jgi:hypothetical protein
MSPNVASFNSPGAQKCFKSLLLEIALELRILNMQYLEHKHPLPPKTAQISQFCSEHQSIYKYRYVQRTLRFSFFFNFLQGYKLQTVGKLYTLFQGTLAFIPTSFSPCDSPTRKFRPCDTSTHERSDIGT